MKKEISYQSVRKWLHLVYWSLASLLVVVSLIAVLRDKVTVEAQATKQLEYLSKAFNENVMHLTQTIDLSLSYIQSEMSFHQIQATQAYHRQIFELLNRNNRLINFGELYLVSKNGDLLSITTQKNITQNISYSKSKEYLYHQEHSTDQIYVGDLIQPDGLKSRNISFSKRLHDTKGNFIGVVGMYVSPEYFQAFYQNLSLPQGSAIQLLHQNGLVYSRYPFSDKWIGNNLQGKSKLLQISNSYRSGTIDEYSSVDGILKRFHYFKDQETGLISVVAMPIQEIYASWYEMILSRIFMILVSLSVLYVILRYLDAKLHKLEDLEKEESRLELAIRRVLEATSKEYGTHFFHSYTRQISNILNVSYALVAVIDKNSYGAAATVSLCSNGQIVDNISYALRGTPCENVMGNSLVYYPSNLQKLFPNDDILKQMGVESYMGIPLYNSESKPIGIIALLDEEPIHDVSLAKSLLTVFSPRVGAELERMELEKLREEAEINRQTMVGQTLQSQKLEAMGRFAGGIAHDFNNVLTTIQGNIDLISRHLHPDEQISKYLNRAAMGSQRAKELVAQILLFSRKQTAEKKLTDISELITEVHELMASALPTNIQFLLEMKVERARVLCDATQLHQVIMNLCTNAIHAMKEVEGKLIITLDKTTMRFHEGKCDGFKITISDTGTGMDQETIKRVFEPFFTTKSAGQGTGLGLAMVHNIVAEHDGYVEVHSQLNKGTTFEVFLPAYQGDISSSEKAQIVQDTVKVQKGTKIMVVDDEESILELITDILQAKGFIVSAFTSPVKAMEALNQNPLEYAALITDFTMPHISGVELAKMALKLRPDFPIVISTGISATENEFEEIKDKVVIMHKPYNFKKLVEVLGKLLTTSQKAA